MPNDLPGRISTALVIVLLSAFIVIGVVHLANHFAGYPLMQRIVPGTGKPQELPLGVPLSIAVGVVRIATIVSFLVWIYGAANNCSRLGAADLTYSPGWAVGAFLLPVYNLVAPYLVMQEIWRASAPRQPRDSDTEWREGKPSVAITIWWTCCILSLLPVLLPTFSLYDLTTRSDIAPAFRLWFTAFVLYSNLTSMLAALFGALSVYFIRQRQLQRFEQLRSGQLLQ